MSDSGTSGGPWAAALAAVAIVALLGGVYLVDQAFRLPGRAVEAGRDVARDLLDLAAAFREGRVETEFAGYAGRVSATNKLQVAVLRQVEIFTRTERSTVLWGTLRLPDVVVEARVPIEYVYVVPLDDTWRFELQGNRLTVLAPALAFNTPALDVSNLEYEIRASSILRDEDAAIADLQAGLTELARGRAGQLQDLIRETARSQVEEFVAGWLAATFEGDEGLAIEVVFAGEDASGEGAALDRSRG